MLRGIFRCKKSGVIGRWRKLHNMELNKFYYSPDIFQIIKLRIMGWVGHVALMEVIQNVCKIVFVKPEGKRQFVRSKRKWENNVK